MKSSILSTEFRTTLDSSCEGGDNAQIMCTNIMCQPFALARGEGGGGFEGNGRVPATPVATRSLFSLRNCIMSLMTLGGRRGRVGCEA